jgi:hypothetical protein
MQQDDWNPIPFTNRGHGLFRKCARHDEVRAIHNAQKIAKAQFEVVVPDFAKRRQERFDVAGCKHFPALERLHERLRVGSDRLRLEFCAQCEIHEVRRHPDDDVVTPALKLSAQNDQRLNVTAGTDSN